jgi:thiamine-monophosphate kinase
MPGEFDLIDWIRAQQRKSDLVLVGPGDDLAVLKWDAHDLLIVGVDQVLDGVHFDSKKHSPRQVGRKVMNRNLSDCAAMACLPAAAVVSVALPADCGIDYAREIYRGLRDAADPFDCAIVGGDTGTWAGALAVSVTILGRSAGISPITRAGATAGQGIFVTGPLGGSLLGRHLEFVPRVHLARLLAETGQISAMIDISDGLSRDIGHICRQSGVGAVIDAAKIPIHDDAMAMFRLDHRPPLEHALHDGEDHELLFTTGAAADDLKPLDVIQIGKTTAEPGIWLETNGRREPLVPRGWEHAL